MRVLVLGASGYLGSAISRKARAAGHVVTGTKYSGVDDHLRQLDIRNRGSVEQAIRETGPDAVVNAAYRKQDWSTTAVAPGHIAAACRTAGSRFVHISSDAVFGGDLDI